MVIIYQPLSFVKTIKNPSIYPLNKPFKKSLVSFGVLSIFKWLFSSITECLNTVFTKAVMNEYSPYSTHYC